MNRRKTVCGRYDRQAVKTNGEVKPPYASPFVFYLSSVAVNDAFFCKILCRCVKYRQIFGNVCKSPLAMHILSKRSINAFTRIVCRYGKTSAGFQIFLIFRKKSENPPGIYIIPYICKIINRLSQVSRLRYGKE